MLASILFGFATALLGAGALITLEGWYHDNWSTNIVIRLGDGVFLPVFNALTITQIHNISLDAWMIVVACIGTLFILFCYQIIERHLRKSESSGAVFYHEFFTAFESFYVTLALVSLPLVSVAKLFLLGYVLTFIFALWSHASEFSRFPL